jgi:signal transduction histidine kinase
VSFARAAPLLAGISAIGGVAGYGLARTLVLVWPLVERRRQTRLFWALTSAQLVAALVVVWSVAVILTIVHGQGRFGPPFGPEVLSARAGALAYALAWISTRLLPTITAFLVAGLVVSLFVLPLAATVSHLGLRRTTRRVEELAHAADALRAGDLTTRVPVSGADEVAHLQAAFNAMATALERTLKDLQGERDRVAGLLEAHRQLVVSVSHELRTPVATLRGYLESAQRREEETLLASTAVHAAVDATPVTSANPASGDHRNGAALRADLATMQREVIRLQALIDDLFTLSRAEVGRLSLRLAPTDVVAAVHRLVETAAPLAWRQRRVEVLVTTEGSQGEIPPAFADPQRVEQILSNLLGNAIRHTPPGGLVVVAATAEGDAIRIDVRDTGAGIDPDDLAHVFERFYRGPAEDGTGESLGEGAVERVGLGLALVKELAEAMGGTAEATSAPGEGSCFTVRLPRA